jgi:hypothetical protein
VIRDAGRNRVDDGLGIRVNFFPWDGLASEVRWNVDRDTTLTVIANGCYRWLGAQRRGAEEISAKKLDRRFVETGGTVEIRPDGICGSVDRHATIPFCARQRSRGNPCPSRG